TFWPGLSRRDRPADAGRDAQHETLGRHEGVDQLVEQILRADADQHHPGDTRACASRAPWTNGDIEDDEGAGVKVREVIVSGAGPGIWKATAAAFARAGDRVLILGRRAEALERAAGEINGDVGDERVSWASVDLTDSAAVERLELPDVVDVL